MPPAPASSSPHTSTAEWYRLPSSAGWPGPPTSDAFTGLAGRFVETVVPFSEADPVAILSGFLTAFSCAVGPGPHAMVGATVHSPRLFVGHAGPTAVGRKGDAIQPTVKVFARAVPEMRVRSGLATGEGLVHLVRDRTETVQPVRERGRIVGNERVIVDDGEADKRLCLIESEGVRLLRVMRRDANTLSPVIRAAWDGGDLHVLTKNAPAKATGAHITLVLQLPLDEVRREMTAAEGESGFANRFIWLCVRRAQELPEPAPFSGAALRDMVVRVSEQLQAAQRIGVMQRDVSARALWLETYHDLSRPRPGLAGAITQRAPAQVLRLSMAYALLEGLGEIRVPHLRAALALWSFSEASAAYIFGDALGHPEGDLILRALPARGPLDRTTIRDLFGRNVPASRIDEGLRLLAEYRKAIPHEERTGGRPRQVWTAASSTFAPLWSYVVPEGSSNNGSNHYDKNDLSTSDVNPPEDSPDESEWQTIFAAGSPEPDGAEP